MANFDENTRAGSAYRIAKRLYREGEESVVNIGDVGINESGSDVVVNKETGTIRLKTSGGTLVSSVILHDRDPVAADGYVGSIYLNTATNTLFVKETATQWQELITMSSGGGTGTGDITNTTLNITTPSAESETDAPSRRAVAEAIKAVRDALEAEDAAISANIAAQQTSIQTLITKVGRIHFGVSGNTLTLTDPDGADTTFTAGTGGGGGTALTQEQLNAINSIASLTTRLTTAETTIADLTPRLGTAETAISTLQTDVAGHTTKLSHLNNYVSNVEVTTVTTSEGDRDRIIFTITDPNHATSHEVVFTDTAASGGASLTPAQREAIENVATLMTQVATLQTEVNKLKPTIVSAIPADLSTLIPDRRYTLPSGDSFYVKSRQGHAEYPMTATFGNLDLSNTGALIQGFIKPNITFSSIPNVSSSTSTLTLAGTGTLPAYIDAILIFKESGEINAPADIGILWNKQRDGSLSAPNYLTLKVRLPDGTKKERQLSNFRENSSYALYFSSNVYTTRDAEFFELDATEEPSVLSNYGIDILLPDNTSVVPDGTQTFYDVVNLQTGELDYEYGSAEMPRAVVGKRLYDREEGDEYLGVAVVDEGRSKLIVEPVEVGNNVYGYSPNTQNAITNPANISFINTLLFDLNEDKEEGIFIHNRSEIGESYYFVKEVGASSGSVNKGITRPASVDNKEERKDYFSLKNFTGTSNTGNADVDTDVLADGVGAVGVGSTSANQSKTLGYKFATRKLYISMPKRYMNGKLVYIYGLNVGFNFTTSPDNDLHYISAHGNPDGDLPQGTNPTGMNDNGIAEIKINHLGIGHIYLAYDPATSSNKMKLYLKRIDDNNTNPLINVGSKDVTDDGVVLTRNNIASVGSGASEQKYVHYTFDANNFFGESSADDFFPDTAGIRRYAVAVVETNSAGSSTQDTWFYSPPKYFEANGIKIDVEVKHSAVVHRGSSGTADEQEGQRSNDDDLHYSSVQYYCESEAYTTSQVANNGKFPSNYEDINIAGINADGLYFNSINTDRVATHTHPHNRRVPYEFSFGFSTQQSQTDVVAPRIQTYWKLTNRAIDYKPTDKKNIPLPDAERLSITAIDKGKILNSLQTEEKAVVFQMRQVVNTTNLLSDYVSEKYQPVYATTAGIINARDIIHISSLMVEGNDIYVVYDGDENNEATQTARNVYARIRNLTTDTNVGELIRIGTANNTEVNTATHRQRRFKFTIADHGIEAGDFVAVYFSNADETQQYFRSPPTIIWREVGHPVRLGNRYLQYEELARGRVNVTTANRYVLFNPDGSATSFDLSNYDEDDVLEFHIQEWTISLQQYSQIGSVRVGEIFALPRSSAGSPIATTGAADSIRFRVDGRNVSIGWDTQSRLLVTTDNTSRDPDPLIIYRPYISV